MIYSAPTLSVSAATVKGCLRLLLPLPLCVLLIGCDSQSANSPILFEQASAQTENDSVVKTAADEMSIANTESDSAVAVADNVDYGDQGQSLMAVAQTESSARPARAPMLATPDSSSSLQATLIGDYVGMVPCSFCNSIAVTLNLYSDGSVVKTSIYDNPSMQQAPLTESGIYRQDNRVITIVYEDQRIESYHIDDNHLVMIDDDELPDTDYTLARK